MLDFNVNFANAMRLIPMQLSVIQNAELPDRRSSFPVSPRRRLAAILFDEQRQYVNAVPTLNRFDVDDFGDDLELLHVREYSE